MFDKSTKKVDKKRTLKYNTKLATAQKDKKFKSSVVSISTKQKLVLEKQSQSKEQETTRVSRRIQERKKNGKCANFADISQVHKRQRIGAE